ncbi:MAG: hypothetical protein IKI15_08710 [Lachnospiraceae bacterium]|nr:hypothetical protein [Lachnospiraceae bacterium]
MVNNEKIKLMTKMAVYENSPDGKEDMQIANYFKSDYIRHEIIKTILAVTFGSIILVAMVLCYQMEFVLDHALELNYLYLGRMILAAYLVLVVVGVAVTWIICKIRYIHSHGRLNNYYRMLNKVRKLEEKEEWIKDMEEE